MPRAKKNAAETQPIIAYKGFDADWTCRGFKFEVGQTYRASGRIARCENGFHACEHPFHVWDYYDGAGIARPLAEVALGGNMDRETDGDTKIAAAEITIRAELKLPDIIKRGVAWILAQAKGNTATGYRGHAAATGYRGHAAATGDRGHAAATGDGGHAAATGYRGHAAATGDRGHAAATGDGGHAAATGDGGHAAATGYRGHAAATGDGGHAAATGDGGHAAATGDRGHAAATGYRGHAAATGDRGHAAATGKWGIAASLGPSSTAKAGPDGWLVLAAWEGTYDGWALRQVRAAKVGGPEDIKPDVVYRLTVTGDFEEVA